MKKLLSLILCLVLLCSLLTVGASAFRVVPSPQNLTVNGKPVACEKYNIDDSNYFKLRDLAYLLMGTDAEFGVSYDPEANSVIVVPGMPYEPVGGELEIGEDKSSTAQPSGQSIWIMGTDSADLSIYNIGDNNYFKLRDMGRALGFLVEYDEDTNTAIVLTGDYANSPVGNVKQILAFDKVWDWVQANYTFAAADDLYYLMDNVEWDDGDITEYWLADVTLDGEPMLALRSICLFPDGSAGEAWLYIPRNTRPFDGEYYYYFDYPGEADFCGTLTLDPAAFDAYVTVTFDTVTEGYDQENIGIAADNMTAGLSWLLECLDELIRSEPALSATVSFADFGFTRAALTE